MRLLVDSHVFLWLLYAPDELGAVAIETIENAEEVVVSTVSLWELALKHGKGKLPHPPSELVEGVSALNLSELGIAHRHLVALPTINLPHGDPFDALLVAQARADGLTLVTADRLLLRAAAGTIDARA